MLGRRSWRPSAGGERLDFLILGRLKTPGPDIELVRMAVTHPGSGIGNYCCPPRSTSPSTSAVRGAFDLFDDNIRTRRIYRAAGFRDEATLPQVARKADGLDGALVIMFDERHAIPRYAATVPRVT